MEVKTYKNASDLVENGPRPLNMGPQTAHFGSSGRFSSDFEAVSPNFAPHLSSRKINFQHMLQQLQSLLSTFNINSCRVHKQLFRRALIGVPPRPERLGAWGQIRHSYGHRNRRARAADTGKRRLGAWATPRALGAGNFCLARKDVPGRR